jgi:hypothetical protein
MTSTLSDAAPGDCARSIAIDAPGDIDIHQRSAAPRRGPSSVDGTGGCQPTDHGNTCPRPMADSTIAAR